MSRSSALRLLSAPSSVNNIAAREITEREGSFLTHRAPKVSEQGARFREKALTGGPLTPSPDRGLRPAFRPGMGGVNAVPAARRTGAETRMPWEPRGAEFRAVAEPGKRRPRWAAAGWEAAPLRLARTGETHRHDSVRRVRKRPRGQEKPNPRSTPERAGSPAGADRPAGHATAIAQAIRVPHHVEANRHAGRRGPVKIRPDVGQSMPSMMRKSRSTPSERATNASW